MKRQLFVAILVFLVLTMSIGLSVFAEDVIPPTEQVTEDNNEPVTQPVDEMEPSDETEDADLPEDPETPEVPEDTEEAEDPEDPDASPIMKLIMERIQNWNGLQEGELERIALVASRRLHERLQENWDGDLSEEDIGEALDSLLETLHSVLVDEDGNMPEMSEEDTDSIAELISGTMILLDSGIIQDDILEFAREAIQQNVDAQGIKQIANTVSGFAEELIEEGEIDDPEVLQERLRERLRERFEKISAQREKVAEAHQRSEENKEEALKRAEEKREEALKRAEEKREKTLVKGNKDIDEIEEKATRERERVEAQYEKSLEKMGELNEAREDDPDEDEASDEEDPAVEEEPIQSDLPESNRIRKGRD